MNYNMPTAIVISNIKALFMSCDDLYNLLSKTNLYKRLIITNRTFFKTLIGRYTITQNIKVL